MGLVPFDLESGSRSRRRSEAVHECGRGTTSARRGRRGSRGWEASSRRGARLGRRRGRTFSHCVCISSACVRGRREQEEQRARGRARRTWPHTALRFVMRPGPASGSQLQLYRRLSCLLLCAPFAVRVSAPLRSDLSRCFLSVLALAQSLPILICGTCH